MPAKYILNESDYAKVEELASNGCDTRTIADQLGFDRATFYRHTLSNNELMRRYKKGKAHLEGIVCGKLIENCKNGDNASLFFYLKTRCNWVEGDKSKSIIKKLLEYIRSFPDKLIDKEQLAKTLAEIAELEY